MLLSNTVSEFASVDGEEVYDKVGATMWLNKFSRSVDMPMMIRFVFTCLCLYIEQNVYTCIFIYDKVGVTMWLNKFSRSVDMPMMIRFVTYRYI
jgi:hypothetical protein